MKEETLSVKFDEGRQKDGTYRVSVQIGFWHLGKIWVSTASAQGESRSVAVEELASRKVHPIVQMAFKKFLKDAADPKAKASTPEPDGADQAKEPGQSGVEPSTPTEPESQSATESQTSTPPPSSESEPSQPKSRARSRRRSSETPAGTSQD